MVMLSSAKPVRDKYNGDKCVIFGNGPSLTIDHVKRVIKSKIFTFVANGFCLIFDKIKFTPDVVCMSNYDAIMKYGAGYPTETLKFFREGWQQHINYNIENVYELPFSCEHDLGNHKGSFVKDGNFTLDPWKENFCGDTVLLDFAVPLAYYMGFNEIYLIGVDCDYSKGYFTERYSISAKDTFKGMVNNDYSIAIPSYRYVNNFLTDHGRKIYKLTESKQLGFIETCSLNKAFGD